MVIYFVGGLKMKGLLLVNCILDRLPNTAETFFVVSIQGGSMSKIEYYVN